MSLLRRACVSSAVLHLIVAAYCTEVVVGSAAPEEVCMNISQLKEAVQAAAWNTNIRDIPRSAVMLTSCDEKCLQMLFDPFIWALEHSRDGDLSRHLIVVGHGMEAYMFCEQLRLKHQHQCVLDRWCTHPGNHQSSIPGSSQSLREDLKSPGHHALLRRITWAAEIINMGMSVMWTHMDITYFSNPLKFIFNAAPLSDVVLNTEDWGGQYTFKGDVCEYPAAEDHDAACMHKAGVNLMEGVCCHARVNGRLWLVNPGRPAASFLKAWHAIIFEELVVRGVIWNGTSSEAQSDMLGGLVKAAKFPGSSDRLMNATLFKWDIGTEKYVAHGWVSRSWDERIYLISPMRINSMCGGRCGFKWNAMYSGHWSQDLQTWAGDGYAHRWVGEHDAGKGGEGDNAPSSRQLVCLMPEEYARKMIGFHQNCNFHKDHTAAKRARMLTWRNWTAHACADSLDHPPLPLYLISAVRLDATEGDPRKIIDRGYVDKYRRLYASIQFHLIQQWVIVHHSINFVFKKSLAPEEQMLSLEYGQSKIYETMMDLPPSSVAAQWNRGLDILPPGPALVYFISVETVVHPHFWVLAASKMKLGHIYTFDQYRHLPASVSRGYVDVLGAAEPLDPIDTSQFVADTALIGKDRFAADDPGGGKLLGRLAARHPDRFVYLEEVAAFYNFSHQTFSSLLPLPSRRRHLSGQAAATPDAFSGAGWRGRRMQIDVQATDASGHARKQAVNQVDAGRRMQMDQQVTPATSTASFIPNGVCDSYKGLPPIYIISYILGETSVEVIQGLYASMQFQLITQWILVYDVKDVFFQPTFTAEGRLLELFYKGVKILELAHQAEGSSSGSAQRNKGLDLISGDGLVYFINGDNVVHPNFWPTLVSRFTLGHFYTFDQWSQPPALVKLGDGVEAQGVGLEMCVFDTKLIGKTRFEVTNSTAEVDFIATVYQENRSAHVYLNSIAAFDKFSQRDFVSVFPLVLRKAWGSQHG